MLLDQCKNDLHREIITEGFEIADECFEANASVHAVVENRRHAIKAVMCALLGLGLFQWKTKLKQQSPP